MFAKLKSLIFPYGSTQTIRSGYLKGNKLVVTKNTQFAPLFGRWEPTMQKLFANLITKNDVYFDLGANFGIHGMLVSKLTNDAAKIVNFEPLEENIQEINHLYSLNGIKNYLNVQKAVSNKVGKTSFFINNHSGQGSLEMERGNNNQVEVQTITLDEYVKNQDPPTFIKMDIEGAEGDALEGFANSIEKSFPKMIIELHSPEADLKVGKFLKEFKYSAFRFDTFGKKLKFEKILDFEKPFPNKDGIWGTIFCLPHFIDIDSLTFEK